MNILIIENSKTLSQLLFKTLNSYGYSVSVDDKNFSSQNLIKSKIFDVCIMNTNLGDTLSKKILKYIVDKSTNTKILGICNRGSWVEKVEFLKRGGDDVLTYPFPIQELLARIQSLMRRPKNYVDKNLYIGDFMLDLDNKSVYKDNADMDIRKKEYDLFEYLVRNKDRVISRCELLDHVWDYREYIGSNTIDVHIKRLRDKLQDKTLIETVHGVGYQVKEPKAS